MLNLKGGIFEAFGADIIGEIIAGNAVVKEDGTAVEDVAIPVGPARIGYIHDPSGRPMYGFKIFKRF